MKRRKRRAPAEGSAERDVAGRQVGQQVKRRQVDKLPHSKAEIAQKMAF